MSRKVGESVVLGDGDVIITVLEVEGRRVRIGVAAPKEVPIMRDEMRTAKREGEGGGECSSD